MGGGNFRQSKNKFSTAFEIKVLIIPSTSASACVGILLRISAAELPRIRRIPNLLNRFLICSSTSLPVWLASGQLPSKPGDESSCALVPATQGLHHNWEELDPLLPVTFLSQSCQYLYHSHILISLNGLHFQLVKQ